MKTFSFLPIRILCVLYFGCVLVSTVYAQAKNCNCCTQKHKVFDFWKGEWKVFTPDGKLAGTNTIEKIQNDCILRENWISTNAGFTGTSYNFYNANTGQWEQLWIDNQGQSLHLKGGLINGSMVLQSSPLIQKDGSKLINKVTWTPLKQGQVRQLWETKKGDAAWVTVFDGTYKPISQE